MKKLSIVVAIFLFFLSSCSVPLEVEVNFETNGGSKISAMVFNEESTFNLPNEPTKEGYTFDGWYLDKTFETPFSVEGVLALEQEGTITLYAFWKVNQYTIEYIDHEGEIIKSYNFNFGDDISNVSSPNQPLRRGYNFLDWDQALPIKMPSHNIKIKPTWEIIQITITFDPVEGTRPSNPVDKKIMTEMEYHVQLNIDNSDLPISSLDGAVFAGWYYDNGTKFDVNDIVEFQDLTVYAKFYRSETKEIMTTSSSFDVNGYMLIDDDRFLLYGNFIRMVDNEFKTIWSKSIDFDIIKAKLIENELILLGRKYNQINENSHYDIVLSKIDLNGELIFKYYFGGESEEKPRDFIKKGDEIFIVGESTSYLGDFTDGNSPGFILNVSLDGAVNWDKKYSICNGISSIFDYNNSIYTIGTCNKNIFIYELNDKGELIKSNVISNSESNVYIREVNFISPQKIIMAGMYNKTPSRCCGNGSYAAMILHIDFDRGVTWEYVSNFTASQLSSNNGYDSLNTQITEGYYVSGGEGFNSGDYVLKYFDNNNNPTRIYKGGDYYSYGITIKDNTIYDLLYDGESKKLILLKVVLE